MRLTFRGRQLLPVLLLASVSLPVSANAGLRTSPPSTSVWELTRTAGSTSYDLSLSWGVRPDAHGYGAVVAVRDGKAGAKAALWATEYDTRGGVDAAAQAAGRSVSCIDAALPCSSVLQSAALVVFRLVGREAGQDAPSRIFVVVHGVLPQLDAQGSKGYRIRKVAVTVQAVRDEQSDSFGVQAAAQVAAGGTHAFLAATAPGGNKGSIAIAVPPCDQASSGVRVGVGTLTLTGGSSPASMTCPAHDSRDIAAVAPSKTTWAATGPVVGASSGSVRLIVLDAH